MASSRNLVSTIGALASPKWGTEPGVRKGKRSLLACHTRCLCPMEITRNSVKVKVGIKVMKLVESLIQKNVSEGISHVVFYGYIVYKLRGQMRSDFRLVGLKNI